jgi:hypothetical protein
MNWSKEPNYPRPDYLSSSRKRLAPQLLFKGGILHGWKKKIAVALNKNFFDTLPEMRRVSRSKADIAWLIYDLELIKDRKQGAGRCGICASAKPLSLPWRQDLVCSNLPKLDCTHFSETKDPCRTFCRRRYY